MTGLAAASLMALGRYGSIPVSTYGTIAPWIKFGYAAALAGAAAWLTLRLVRPVARLRPPQYVVAAVIAAMGALGLATLFTTAPGDWRATALGHSWSICPWNVLVLSLPALGCTLWALRGMAPARPRAAGFAAGIFAGALGTFGYALSCTEASPTFVALWYSLGIGCVGAVGAMLAPRILRW